MKIKNISKYSCNGIQLFKQFYNDQQGVYMLMTGLLSFILLGVIALTVDGSGLLLDKARLQQGTEQATLALVSESNDYRQEKNHADVTRQVVTSAEMAAFGGDKFKTQQYKRNQELVQGFVKVYLRTPYNNQNNSVDSPAAVTVDKDFDYKCEEIQVTSAKSEYLLRKPVVCQVRAEVNRKSWLYLKDTSLSFDKREKINSGTTYASKEKSVVIPIDLIMVNDLSGSMYENSNGGRETNPANQKIQNLRNVVDKISEILIPDQVKEGVSPYNRIGVVTFGLGSQQKNYVGTKNTPYCNLPYAGDERVIEVAVKFGGLTPHYWWKGRYVQDKMCGVSAKLYDQLTAAGFSVRDYRGVAFNRNRAEGECKNSSEGKAYSQMYVTGKNTEIMKNMLHNFRPAYYGYGQSNEAYDKFFYAIQKSNDLTREIDKKTEVNIQLPFVYAFYSFFNIDKTLRAIDSLDGKDKVYPVYYEKNDHCLGNRNSTNGQISERGNPKASSTHAWFNQQEKTKLINFMNALRPEGSTLSSSGMLIGANLLMDKNPKADAQPKNVGVNTQRILLVMSDGKDTILTDLTKELQEKGMCQRIRNRLDTLQDRTPGIKVLPAKLAFVMFGNQVLSPAHKTAWINCVGQKNYFEAKNEAQLLDAFKQIINIDEEVGKLSNEKPKFN